VGELEGEENDKRNKGRREAQIFTLRRKKYPPAGFKNYRKKRRTVIVKEEGNPVETLPGVSRMLWYAVSVMGNTSEGVC